MVSLNDKANVLRALHRGPRILVLPNAWDAAGARIFERAGFLAIATTSAGIAATLGYADGQRVSRDEMLAVVRTITRNTNLPVTADLEAGYGATPVDVRDTARLSIEAGAVGLNLEDGVCDGPQLLVQTSQHAAKIRAVRETARARGVDLVLNARTDVYLKSACEATNRFAHAVHRGNAYLEAGADCVFVPGVTDSDTIANLVREIHGPVNILAGPGTPPVSELSRMGVARVSLGSGPMRATLGLLERIARELIGDGTFQALTDGAMSYSDMNALFE